MPTAGAPSPELIVRRRPDAPADAVLALHRVVREQGLRMTEVAPVPGTRRGALAPGRPLRDLHHFCRLHAPSGLAERPGDVAEALRRLDAVDQAYIKPPALPPVLRGAQRPAATPAPGGERRDFRALQGYLAAAPHGIGIEAAWAQGGFGERVRIVDVELAWRFSHEDLRDSGAAAVAGREPREVELRNHGTSVAGMLVAEHNDIGIQGLCPAAELFGISIGADEWATSSAIYRAAQMLHAGDVLLLELERRPGDDGPDTNEGFVPIEFWPDDFDAIRHATSRGVLVVEPAANGSVLLDTYSNEDARWFPEGWDPFGRDGQDSGAIVVGAGGPAGTPDDLAPLWFTNHGACVDVQGWGAGVTTTGGVGPGPGDLLGGVGDEDRWYTRSFNGTSSAAPMVAGALACVQGLLRAEGLPPLTPAQARAALRLTGTPQRGADRRIGSRPDVGALLDWARSERLTGDGTVRPRPREAGAGMQLRITIDVTEGPEGLAVSTADAPAPPAPPAPDVHGRVQLARGARPYVDGGDLVIPVEDARPGVRHDRDAEVAPSQVRGPSVAPSQVRGPEAGVPQVRGPEAGVTQVRGPEAGVPQVRGPEAGVAQVRGPGARDYAPVRVPLDLVRAALAAQDERPEDG